MTSSFPSAPLSSRSWQHPTLVDGTLMHTNIDVPLDQLAQSLGLQGTSYPMPVLRLGLFASATLPLNAVIPYDTTYEDSAGTYDPFTYQWTCPTSGLYLVTGNLIGLGASTPVLAFNGLDTTKGYPSGQITGNNIPGSSSTQTTICSTPLYIAAGALCYASQIRNNTATTFGYTGSVTANYLDIVGLAPA